MTYSAASSLPRSKQTAPTVYMHAPLNRYRLIGLPLSQWSCASMKEASAASDQASRRSMIPTAKVALGSFRRKSSSNRTNVSLRLEWWLVRSGQARSNPRLFIPSSAA